MFEEDIEIRVKQIMKDITSENRDFSLNEELVMDSMKFIRLIVELEQSFNIEVDFHDLVLENFLSLNSICAYISSRIQ
ncbi:D-alanine--poly(phosphoribitol) ligase subunit 2 [compost metagenome]